MLVLAVLALVSANALAETGPPRPSWTHTRALTAAAAALLAEAAQRSSVIRTLLDDLERTDVVVYLSDSMYGSEGEPRAYLTFVTAAAGIRYLLVRIDPGRSLPCERIVWLGHELQHALEIAEAPEVRDANGVRQLYTRIGWEDGEGQFETRHARATSDRIRNEMGRHGGGTSPG